MRFSWIKNAKEFFTLRQSMSSLYVGCVQAGQVSDASHWHNRLTALNKLGDYRGYICYNPDSDDSYLGSAQAKAVS